ncbi:hypothetical protein FOMPIDRAFT_139591 [Fomitopsis schrenkii]|uniref:K Homology domain-containing protein n=1 Tax=Fomitopsis schrenkii TaxID=2126942 RepID=S8EIA9_FOMSC|nr:hypothetical protein FOMPIDRAFT_139591 [Fomitopsis schrenkii]
MEPPTQRNNRAPSLATSQSQVKSAFPNGVEEHLASVTAAGLAPTMSDLERCRPARYPYPRTPKYGEEYNAVVSTLCRCFSKAQLRGFLASWDVNTPLAGSKRKKVEYAESIIENMWGWPSLKEIQRAARDRTEVATKIFPVNASEMFLILGKDGADLLGLSRAYNVHVSLNTQPFALRVEGVRGSLKSVGEHIDNIKKSITAVEFPLPAKVPFRQHILQRISRLTGALVELTDVEGTVRIFAKTPRSLEIAKRLVARASHELLLNASRERLAYEPSPSAEEPVPAALFPSAYALYPFLSSQPLPWTIKAGGAFRMRRVGAWLNHVAGEDSQATGGLAGGRGRLLTRSKAAADLQEVLLQDLPGPSGTQLASRRVVRASTGHILLTTASPGQRASLVPPFPGSHAFTELLNWMNRRGAKTGFVPSLPAPLVNSSPATEKVIHRVVYRAVLPLPSDGQHHVPVHKFLSFETVLVQPRADAGSFDDQQPVGDLAEDAAIPALYTDPECYLGYESEVDVMLPDRPVDIQFSGQSLTLITPGEEPPELQTYTTELRTFLTDESADGKQPDPPLRFSFAGDTWVMLSSTSVRRSVETLVLRVGTLSAGENTRPMEVISESILDLESNQKTVHCELVCDDPTSTGSWGRFLADCDALTSVAYQPIGAMAFEDSRDDNTTI